MADLVEFFSMSHVVTFFGIKFHAPFFGPFQRVVYVPLKADLILNVSDWKVN